MTRQPPQLELDPYAAAGRLDSALSALESMFSYISDQIGRLLGLASVAARLLVQCSSCCGIAALLALIHQARTE